jgi:hypothetical protein
MNENIKIKSSKIRLKVVMLCLLVTLLINLVFQENIISFGILGILVIVALIQLKKMNLKI